LFDVEFFVVSGVFSDAKRNNDCVSVYGGGGWG
jgi:hypothetical protein